MERRAAIRNMAILFGGAISATTVGVIIHENRKNKKINHSLFTDTQEKTLEMLADLIIPDTDVPGAKAAAVGPFICMMIKECYPEGIQDELILSLIAFEDNARNRFGGDFLTTTPKNQKILIEELRLETISQKHTSTTKEPKVYLFEIVRDLTILGYFTSEIGATQACVYLPVPGYYNGNLDLKPGQKRWYI